MSETAEESAERVSPLELFFDLIFVFTVTQVALILEQNPSWTSTGRAALELPVIFWMYGGYAWLTNALRTDARRQSIALLLGMAAFLVVSLSVPRAFGDDAKTFGVAYLALTAIHLGCFLILADDSTFGAMLRIGLGNLIAAGLILAAAFVDEGTRWPFWLAAILVQFAPAVRSSGTGAFDIGVEHFAERHELMIIIVLGESIVSVAIGAQQQPVDAALIIGTLCGLAAAAALWWCYFGSDNVAAAAALGRASTTARGRLALLGYDVPHVLMLGGVIGVAAGSRLSLPTLTRATSLNAAAFIAGGVAVYLVGLAAFRAVIRHATPLPRFAAAAVAPATIPIGTHLGAAQQLSALTGVIVVLLAIERSIRRAPAVVGAA